MQRRLCAVSSVLSRIQSQIQSSPVLVYSKSYCPYCTQVKELFEDMDVPFTAVELDLLGKEGSEIQDGLAHLTRQKTVPNVFIGGNHVGGASDVMKANQAGTLHTLLKNALPDYD